MKNLFISLYNDLRHYFWRRSTLKSEVHFIKCATPKVGDKVTVCRSSIYDIDLLRDKLVKHYRIFEVPYSFERNPIGNLIEIIRIK